MGDSDSDPMSSDEGFSGDEKPTPATANDKPKPSAKAEAKSESQKEVKKPVTDADLAKVHNKERRRELYAKLKRLKKKVSAAISLKNTDDPHVHSTSSAGKAKTPR